MSPIIRFPCTLKVPFRKSSELFRCRERTGAGGGERWGESRSFIGEIDSGVRLAALAGGSGVSERPGWLVS